MKILHIAPNAPYNDNWGYQENLLPKYQKKAGHEVTLIVSNRTFKDGVIAEMACADYVSDDGVRIIRLKRKRYMWGLKTSLYSKLDVYPYIKEIAPDMIFYHGLHSKTVYDAVKYKKKDDPSCVIVQDNHMDYNNGAGANGIKNKLIRGFYRRIVKKTVPYISRIYGVTPWRKQYAEEYYGAPVEKTDVLIMGADDEQLSIEKKDVLRQEIRGQYGIADGEFLVVTGGKIDRRKQIHLLIEACSKLSGVKLLIFGNVSDDFEEEFTTLIKENNNAINVGWVKSGDVYKYFFAADLVVFPGGHSVMWEQACASKVPCLFRGWQGIEHLNNGGNAGFLSSVTCDSLKAEIEALRFTPKYREMQKQALSDATDVFLYSNIAKKSVECAEK